MNMKKDVLIAVIFLATAIIFVSSTPMANNAFAQIHDEDNSGSKYYENFQNCLSDASGEYGFPAGDQIVNCLVESGYIQGSSSTSNAVDTKDETDDVQVSVVGDESDEDEDESDEDEDESDEDEDEE